MKRQNGFTLIELMTTLGIATILVSVAIPGLQQFKKNSRQTTVTNELVSAMRVARNTAITTNSRVTVCASRDGTACHAVSWNRGWIAFVDEDSDRILDADEEVLRRGNGTDDVTISSGQFASFFVYRPNGRVMNATLAGNSGQFTICDDRGNDYARTIRLDLSGRARAVDVHSGGQGMDGVIVQVACPLL
jgi:type IV fimbrial biogenesis protein FimT